MADWQKTTTAHFDAGTKSNIETDTDYPAQTANQFQIKYGDLFSDNFDGESDGTTPPANWVKDGTNVPTNFEVDDVHASSGTLSAWLQDTVGNGWCRYNYGAGFDTDPFECEMYFDNTTDVRYLMTEDLAADHAAAAVSVQIQFDGAANINYYDGAWQDTGQNYSSGSWVSIKIIHNCTADTFDMWYEGIKIVTNGGFRNVCTSIKSIHFVSTAPADLWFDDVKLGDYHTTGNWTSDSITMTAGKQMLDLDITTSGCDANNYVDKIEILDASDDSVLYTYSGNLTTDAQHTLTTTDFSPDNDFISTANTNFKVKVYLVGDGSTTPIITDIQGDYLDIAPTVSSTTPAASATGVVISQNIVVVFDQTMDTGTTPSLTETAGQSGATYTFSAWSTTTETNDTATWTHTDWDGHDSITLSVDGAVDDDGSPLASAYSWSFTVEYSNGIYFNSGAQCTSVYDWRCNVSISQVADSCKIVIGNTGGGNVAAVENMDDIQIYHAGSLIFRGLADGVNIEGMGGNKIVITGIGYIKLLMQRFVTESYAAKSRSYMVGDILTNYAPALTGTNVATTSESLTRVIKARSAFDAIDELAGELEYDFWVDTDLDLHWLERSYEASGVTITNGTTTVFSVTLPQRSETIYNKVRVYGDVNAGGGQPVAECIDPASILHYGYTKEADPIHDNSLQTVPECYARGQTFIDRSAWGDPTIMLETPGQYTLQPGTTVELVGFETDYGVVDGSYLVMEKAHSIKTGRTMLTIAKYDSTTEDMIADIIRRVRRKEYEDLDHTATVTKYILAYEDLELEGYTLKVYNIGMGQSMIMGHSTNGIIGNTTDNIVMGNSGRSISLDIEVTET